MWLCFCKKKTSGEKYAEQWRKEEFDDLKKRVDENANQIRDLKTLLRKSGIYISCETCKFDGNCPIVTEDAKQYFPQNIAWCTADNWQPKVESEDPDEYASGPCGISADKHLG